MGIALHSVFVSLGAITQALGCDDGLILTQPSIGGHSTSLIVADFDQVASGIKQEEGFGAWDHDSADPTHFCHHQLLTSLGATCPVIALGVTTTSSLHALSSLGCSL